MTPTTDTSTYEIDYTNAAGKSGTLVINHGDHRRERALATADRTRRSSTVTGVYEIRPTSPRVRRTVDTNPATDAAPLATDTPTGR